jgi:hypothetical protein
VADISIFMQNDLKLSDCAFPDVPLRDGGSERLKVQIKENILTIAEAREGEETGSTIYAQRTLDLGGRTSAFMILPKLPDGVEDKKFFPAIGTVIFSGDTGRHSLRAAGTDSNNGGRCQGWIFNATEQA